MDDLEYRIRVGAGTELDFAASLISKFSSEIKRGINECDVDFRERLYTRMDELFLLN